MKIVAISDVHNRQKDIIIPECDLLISCGDYSFRGEPGEVERFHKWADKQPAKHIISCQGNHELKVERNFELSKQIAKDACPRVHFIDEGLVEIEGVKIWCSAITPWFYDWAWNRRRGDDIKKHWDRIPNDIDILVTHGPPKDILDTVYHVDGSFRENVGCEDLFNALIKIPTLKHHFFGHIHCSYGFKLFNGISFWNVAICDEMYSAANDPVVVDFEK